MKPYHSKVDRPKTQQFERVSYYLDRFWWHLVIYAFDLCEFWMSPIQSSSNQRARDFDPSWPLWMRYLLSPVGWSLFPRCFGWFGLSWCRWVVERFRFAIFAERQSKHPLHQWGAGWRQPFNYEQVPATPSWSYATRIAYPSSQTQTEEPVSGLIYCCLWIDNLHPRWKWMFTILCTF